MTEKEKKGKEEKGRAKTQFNMAVADMNRITELCNAASQYGMLTCAGQHNYLNHWFSALKFINYEISCRQKLEKCRFHKKINEIEKLILDMQKAKKTRKKKLKKVIDELEDLHYKIYVEKQRTGLGIPITWKISAKTAAKRAIGKEDG